MTDQVAKDVIEWLRKNDGQYCDDCIAKSLLLPNRNQAQHVTGAIAETTEFQRAEAKCSLCGSVKLVTGATRN
jgi:hypothetical protein